MKIAFVYDVIYPCVKGGVEKRVWELAVRLAKRGHEVHLFGMKFWEGEAVIKKDDVIIHGVCPVTKSVHTWPEEHNRTAPVLPCIAPPFAPAPF